jgi:hypothetical protein
MKMNYIINPARILNRFGKAWLIKRANGKHELVGGTADDCTEAKEWASLSAHEIVFTRLVTPGRPARPNGTPLHSAQLAAPFRQPSFVSPQN